MPARESDVPVTYVGLLGLPFVSPSFALVACALRNVRTYVDQMIRAIAFVGAWFMGVLHSPHCLALARNSAEEEEARTT